MVMRMSVKKRKKKKQENHLPMVLGFDADGWGDGRHEW